MAKLYLEKPQTFLDGLEVSTVFMEWDSRLLFLQRASHKSSPSLWGVPGGKLEKGESPLQGLFREMKEELSFVPLEKNVSYQGALYVQNSFVNYRLYLFKSLLDVSPKILLNKEEHQNFLWQPIDKVEELLLLEGQIEAFQFVYPNITT